MKVVGQFYIYTLLHGKNENKKYMWKYLANANEIVDFNVRDVGSRNCAMNCAYIWRNWFHVNVIRVCVTYAVWRKKFVEILRCQSFMCVNSLVLTLEVIIPNLYIASRDLTFATKIVYRSSCKIQKSSYVNTVCVYVCGNLQTSVFLHHCT